VFINIDPSSGLPIHLQVVQQIKTAVAMGRLQPVYPLALRQAAGATSLTFPKGV
jgi:DNA-binding transcriptional regulator YhcF (GntR family)